MKTPFPAADPQLSADSLSDPPGCPRTPWPGDGASWQGGEPGPRQGVLSGPQGRVTAAAYDSVAASYDLAYEGRIPLAENAYIQGRLRRLLVSNDKILDIGTGTGLFWDLMPSARGTGLDVSEGMLAIARRRHPGVEFIRGDIETWWRRPAEYTAVVSLFGALSHVALLDRVMWTVRRVAVPGAKAFLMFRAPGAGRSVKVFRQAGTPTPPVWQHNHGLLRELLTPYFRRAFSIRPFIFTGLAWTPRLLQAEVNWMRRLNVLDKAHYFIVTGRLS